MPILKGSSTPSALRVGIVGLGYWGPNIVRIFSALDRTMVVAVCDIRRDAVRRISRPHPHLRVERDYRAITDATDIDAVCVVTPVSTHYEIARRALEQGKHVLVEKPFTAKSAQAERLIALAARKKLCLMVDHTMLFTGAVRKMKEVADSGELGTLLYYDSQRVNLGLFQHDVNVIWDLAPHDLSIVDYLFGEEPEAVSAHGMDHFGWGFEDIAFIVLYFKSKVIAHCNFNWLSPVKVRKILLAGKKKILVWDDIEPDEKIKIYDRGVRITNRESLYKLLVEYRSGDMYAPRLDHKEALQVEAEYFVDGIKHGRKIINDGKFGLRMVRILEACDRSLKQRGRCVKV